MTVCEHLSDSPEATETLGQGLALKLAAGDVILFDGDLAAGKTTMVRGLLRGLGGDPDQVSSPTFVLIRSYPCRSGAIRWLHHVDLYRVDDSERALREIGLEEVLSDAQAAVAVEWPRSALITALPLATRCWKVQLTHDKNEQGRKVLIGPGSAGSC